MDHHQTNHDLANDSRMACTTIGFCIGLPKAEMEGNIYMKLPKGFSLSGEWNHKIVLMKLLKIYMD